MRGASENRIHQARHGTLPTPDAEDLRMLAAYARKDPDRPYIIGPCWERLKSAGLVVVDQTDRHGKVPKLTDKAVELLGAPQ